MLGRGLGYALTEQFIQEGHTVIGCARSTEAVEKLRSSFGSPHSFATVDVADEQQVKAWSINVLKEYEPPDLLINNAAIINQPAPLWQISTEDISQLIDVNIKGVIHIIHHFVPPMVGKEKCIIINLSSAGDVLLLLWLHLTAPPNGQSRG